MDDDTARITPTHPYGRGSWIEYRGGASAGAMPTTGIFATMNAKTGLTGFDLPTESMWEIAARAGDPGLYIGGSVSASLAYGWFTNNNGGKMMPVGQKLPNAYGLYDFAGNIWERTLDHFDDSKDLAVLQPEALIPITSGNYNGSCLKSGGHNSSAGSYWTWYSARSMAGWTHNTSGSHVGFRISYFPR